MSTRRKIKGQTIPKWKYLSKMFKSVEAYLNWVSDSVVQINKDDTERRAKQKELLIKVVAIMLKRARKYSANFERFICVDGKKIKEIKKQVKANLKPRVGNEYVFTLQVKRPRPGAFEVGDQLLAGYPHDVKPGHAYMKLHKQLTLEERGQLRRQVRAILDPDTDYISPERMSKWIAPALKEALLDINDSVISKHAIGVMLVHSREGFFIIFSCLPDTTDKNQVITLKLEVQLSIDIEELPSYFKIPHPFPNRAPYKKRGQEMVKDLKRGFEHGELCVKLYSPLAKQVRLPKIDPDKYKSRAQRIIEKAETDVYGEKKKEVDMKSWRIDFESLEKEIYNRVKGDDYFEMVREAFSLYQTISQAGNKVLPPLNRRTRGALSLWLFKSMSEKQSSRLETFKYLLMMVDGCLEKQFCPAFVQPKLNTLGAESESRKVMFDDDDDAEMIYVEEEEGDENLDEAIATARYEQDEEADSDDEARERELKKHRRDLTKGNHSDDEEPAEEEDRKTTKTSKKSTSKTHTQANKKGKNETGKDTSRDTNKDEARERRDGPRREREPREEKVEVEDRFQDYYTATKTRIDRMKQIQAKRNGITLEELDAEEKRGAEKEKPGEKKKGKPREENKEKTKVEHTGNDTSRSEKKTLPSQPSKNTLHIEETTSVQNFENKAHDDEKHEQEMNNQAASPIASRKNKPENTNRDQPTDDTTPIRQKTGETTHGDQSPLPKLKLAATPRESLTETSSLVSGSTTQSTHSAFRDTGRKNSIPGASRGRHQSVFKLIRDNTEFEHFRKLDTEDRKMRGRSEHDANPRGTQALHTSHTHSTTESDEGFDDNYFEEDERIQKVDPNEKITAIAKLIRIIEENNVGAAIKYIDVYAIKLLIKFQDEHGKIEEEPATAK